VKTLPIILCLGCAPLFQLWAQPPAAVNPQRIVTAASGTFDMSREPRRYPFLLILDQETLRYPSFWTGGNAGGDLTFQPETDALTGGLEFTSTGGFTVHVTNGTRKLGMEDQLPGGPWMVNTRDAGFKIHFESFGEGVPAGERRTRAESFVLVKAATRGYVEVNGMKAPFEAEVTFSFSEKIPAFELRTTFTFRGDALGLSGKQAGPIQATLMCLSPLGRPLPRPVSDPFGEMGF
jgi:hypothetical protein